MRLTPSVADCQWRNSERASGCWVSELEPPYGTMGRLQELLDWRRGDRAAMVYMAAGELRRTHQLWTLQSVCMMPQRPAPLFLSRLPMPRWEQRCQHGESMVGRAPTLPRAIYSSHISRGAIGHEAAGWQRALADRRTGRDPRNRPFRGRGVALGRVLQRKIAALMKTQPTIKAAQL